MYLNIKDRRFWSILILSILVLVFGFLLQQAPSSWVVGDNKDYSDNAEVPTYLRDVFWFKSNAPKSFEPINEKKLILAQLDPKAHVNQRQNLQTQQQFADAAELLKAKHPQQAITLLHQVIRQYPRMPEAHTNLGFAMLDLNELAKAESSFNYAIEINPRQENAYYGLAVVAEKPEDYLYAMGAMRSYLHLRKDDRYMAKARSALDYWEMQLKVKSWQEPSDESAAAIKSFSSSPVTTTAPSQPVN